MEQLCIAVLAILAFSSAFTTGPSTAAPQKMLLLRSARLLSRGRPVQQHAVAYTHPLRCRPLFSTTAAPAVAASGVLPSSGTPQDWVTAAVQDALVKAFGEAGAAAKPLVTPATKPEHGDYQSMAAMPLARPLKMGPADVAQKLIDHLDVAAFCDPPQLTGGFINLKLKQQFVADRISAMLQDEDRLAVPRTAAPQRVVVDFSSPNIAKEMHVGHLRSTIIGDTLCKVLEFLGHDVLRVNHVGDWGTQFGMLITYLKEEVPEALTDSTGAAHTAETATVGIAELVEYYKSSKAKFDADDGFKDRSRAEVVRLQAGDADNLRVWKLLCDISRKQFNVIYDILGVQLEERGESYYNSMLPGIVSDLQQQGLVVESEGAQVVFINEEVSATAILFTLYVNSERLLSVIIASAQCSLSRYQCL
eukprot:973-Heterococcus_DN1.PRE.2